MHRATIAQRDLMGLTSAVSTVLYQWDISGVAYNNPNASGRRQVDLVQYTSRSPARARKRVPAVALQRLTHAAL
jgi:hypothetical protein